MRRKICIIVIIVILFIFVSPISAVDNRSDQNKNATVYTTLVDQIYGFYRVYKDDKTISKPVYHNRTLNISIGDTVFWSNDAVPDIELTIISKQKIWDNNSGKLKWSYKKFGYIFNNSGSYQIYIKEFPIFNQIIIVDLDTIISTENSYIQTNSSNSYIQTNYIQTNSSNSSENRSNEKVPIAPAATVPNLPIGPTSKFDTAILTIVLISMIILSGRIKGNNDK